MTTEEKKAKPVKLNLDNYKHPAHSNKTVTIEIEIDEEKLGKIIEKLEHHKEKGPLTHTANIPPSREYFSTAKVTLL